MPDAVPTDEQVEHLDRAVERAFAERDRLVEVWRNTGRDEDEAAADAQDRHAARLLDQYNDACRAQYAESDRRRNVNVARHARDQAVDRGDLAAALQGDDWLEDHGMHANDRRTCYSCQDWADHAHDPLNGRRITTEEYEREQARRAQLWDQPLETRPPDTSAPRDTTTEPEPQGDTGMNSQQLTGQTWWDRFFAWFDSLWRWPTTDETSDESSSPGGSTGRVSAALAHRRPAQPDPQPAPQPDTNQAASDTRSQPEPQDLDALAAAQPPPRASTTFRRPPPIPLDAWSGVDRGWCSCEGNASCARCRAARRSHLDVREHFQPPPRRGTTSEPAQPNQP